MTGEDRQCDVLNGGGLLLVSLDREGPGLEVKVVFTGLQHVGCEDLGLLDHLVTGALQRDATHDKRS